MKRIINKTAHGFSTIVAVLVLMMAAAAISFYIAKNIHAPVKTSVDNQVQCLQGKGC